MFTVGEFSKIAQVSKRLLRYYDEIGLFMPAYTDPMTSRRFYKAEQMTQLNRILALKDLGLSLDQIRRALQDEVSTDEMQGMLMLKKAEIENQLKAEIQRIRMIESRLNAIRDVEEDKPLNVVIKEMPAQPVLSTRLEGESFDRAVDTMQRIRKRLPEGKNYGLCFVICHETSHTNVDEEDLYLEIGCFVESDSQAIVPVAGDIQLEYRELPPVEMLACSIVEGPLESLLLGYAAIGRWVEANGYRTIGMPREVTLQVPTFADASDMITEVRYPIEPISLA